ncbi:hypothetical protein D3C71_1451280 [compost metagenome]
MVAVFGCDLAHQRALRLVTVPAAAEDGQHLAFSEFVHRLEYILESVRRMCVIHHHCIRLAFLHRLHASADTGDGFQAAFDVFQRNIL